MDCIIIHPYRPGSFGIALDLYKLQPKKIWNNAMKRYDRISTSPFLLILMVPRSRRMQGFF